MKRIPRKSDGRRIYPLEFKREQIGRVLRGEITLAELSRKLGIARALLQRWKRLEVHGGGTGPAMVADASVAMTFRGAEQQIAELQRLVGRQAMEIDHLRAALGALKATRRP